MSLSNPTANQHFVSRTEQQLNALNPDAQPANQRIYPLITAENAAKEVARNDLKRGRG
jgi:hypothetical protein